MPLLLRLATIVTILLSPGRALLAQAQDVQTPPPPAPTPAPSPAPAPAPAPALDADSLTDRLWLSFQANIVAQRHAGFEATYSGVSSLTARPERAASRVETLYSGVRVTHAIEVLFDVESAGGSALSAGHGLGGVTNVDAPTDPTLSASPYVARAMLHATIPLGKTRAFATRNPLSLATTVPVRRLEFRIGKMSPVDFFDLNSACNDSHSQFTNIAVVNNGAYDYASDARGYTYGALAEYDDAAWAVRFGEMLIPYGVNNAQPRWALTHAHSENVEVEYHTTAWLHRATVFRALTFVNHNDTAAYSDAMTSYLAGEDPVPDTSRHRKSGVRKVGVGLSAEHALTENWRAFWRVGWNDGKSEPNPIDRTGSIGIGLHGDRWHRGADDVGVAVAVNGLSPVHRRYLESGGQSSGLGDGHLTYGAERVIETYYNAAVWRGVSLTVAYQLVAQPGFNRDRGPVSVFGVRIHVEDALPLELKR